MLQQETHLNFESDIDCNVQRRLNYHQLDASVAGNNGYANNNATCFKCVCRSSIGLLHNTGRQINIAVPVLWGHPVLLTDAMEWDVETIGDGEKHCRSSDVGRNSRESVDLKRDFCTSCNHFVSLPRTERISRTIENNSSKSNMDLNQYGEHSPQRAFFTAPESRQPHIGKKLVHSLCAFSKCNFTFSNSLYRHS